MKKMAFLALIISLLLIFSCTESGEITTTVEDEITSVYLGESAVDLRLKLFQNKESQNEIDPEIALSGIIELYIESCLDSSSADKPINIYVLYDTGIWDENDEQETFQITMAYQSVENGDLY